MIPCLVIAFTEDPDIVKKILKHLDLWGIKRNPMPVGNAPPFDVFPVYDDPPGSIADVYMINTDYPAYALFKKNF